LEPEHQNRLINWGYAVCDAAIRSHYKPTPAKSVGFSYPEGV
jgi:NTE family protein